MVQIFTYHGDRSEAQDVGREAFCRALARWPRLREYDDPAAWVRRVAWNSGHQPVAAHPDGRARATAQVNCGVPPMSREVAIDVPAAADDLRLRLTWEPGHRFVDTAEGWALAVQGLD